jgi:hypothetical protein
MSPHKIEKTQLQGLLGLAREEANPLLRLKLVILMA